MTEITRRSIFSIVIVAGLAFAGPAVPGAQQAAEPAGPIKVMSFNIRLGTANDGDNHWEKRREMLFEVLRAENPDLIGVQEAFRFQLDQIMAAVPGYAVTGVAREDGKADGETSAILFRASRFHVSDAGTFWFSDTPETPGTRTWGNNYTRISSWARFIESDGSAFWHYNLHLDHQSQPSRVNSTALLLERIEARPWPDEPVIVTGDFNVGEDNAALTYLTGSAGSKGPFVDTFRVLHPDQTEVGTFTAFEFGRTTGDKIDYVLVEPETRVLEAEIVRTSRDGRYPSDHFPVTATIDWD